MDMNNRIRVEIAYATPDRQEIISLEVPPDSTIAQAIEYSGIQERFPEIDLTKQSVGIFSRKCKLTDTVQEGDRVEIYRPLTIDPKDARRAKATKKATA